MTIMLCITGLEMGGAERVVANLANDLIGKGHDVHLVYLSGLNKQKDRISKAVNIIPLNMEKSFLGFFSALLRLCKIISRIKPQVLHGHMYHANIMVRIARIFVKIPKLISTEHSKYIGPLHRMYLYRITDGLSDVNTNVSLEATNEFIKKKAFSKKKSTTVYNGITTSSFSSKSSDRTFVREELHIDDKAFVFLNVGRLTVAKDQELLIHSFSSFYTQHQGIHLIIVGEGEEEQKLKALAQMKGLSNVIHFVGITSHVERYYSASDCFVLTSRWEGFGLVIAEAMAAGLPVIATDAGGCAEVLDNPEYLCKVGDYNAITERMERVYNLDDNDRIALKKQSQESVNRFDHEKIIQIWLKIYAI